MPNKMMGGVFLVALFICLLSTWIHAEEAKHLFDQVEKLNLKRHGYVLGAALNPEQMKIAATNPMDAASSGTFKFKDESLYVVAQKGTNRVLVIYEQFEKTTQQKVQDLIGDLYMSFEDPTVLAHDKVVYWAYTKKGKISSKEFDTTKKEKKKLDILATIKFISDINIMEKTKEALEGHVYYIISSDPILRFFKDQNT